MRRTTLLLPLLLLHFAPASVDAQEQRLDSILRCETEVAIGLPVGWSGGPPQTVAVDSAIVHAGRSALRIQRNATSDGEFTAASVQIRMNFVGDTLELRGYLRTDAVDGFAGLWAREDGRSGYLELDNMQDRGIKGTSDWTEYSIRLPVNPAGRQLIVGVLLVGSGTVWADDLQVLVDGVQIDDVPRTTLAPTVLETDTAFDGGSGIAITSLTGRQADDLAVLGRVWGFVKYHHPLVASGKLHWDYELFRAMPSVLAARDAEARNRAILRWLDRVGIPDACSPCATAPASVHLSAPIEWIDDAELLGRELSERLRVIHARRFAGDEQFYVSHVPGIGNPVFDIESAYDSIDPPDAGYRLLALMRLWNIVQYWFPYRDQLDGGWESVLREFMPRLASAATPESYRLELIALMSRIHDTHANLWSGLDVRPPRGKCSWPVALRHVEGRFVVAEYLDEERGPRSGLAIGDVVLAVDGHSVDSLARAWTPLYAASNEAARRRDIGRSLPRGVCGASTLTIERAGRQRGLVVARDSGLAAPRFAHDRPGETFQMLSPEVAYLKLSSVRAADVPSYIERASTARALVIDIRNYPSEFMVFALGSRLIDTATSFARFTVGDPANPGAFVMGEPIGIVPDSSRYRGRIAILIDEMSQSQAEYTTMALRTAPGAIVVGSTTAGADGNVSPIPLPGGQRGMISGIGVFYPDGRPTQRIGIVPDIVALPTIAGIREGRDEVLEAALRHLLGARADEGRIRHMARRAMK